MLIMDPMTEAQARLEAPTGFVFHDRPCTTRRELNSYLTFCSSLLQWYSTVIYTDVDEFLIPDPEQYKSLSDFCSRNRAASTNAIGLNIIHSPDTDPKFEENRPIIGQRQWARFSFAMCKPLVARVPIQWTPGFHSSNHPPHFDRLFLFHARNFDLPSALLRFANREMPWDDGPPDHYQRWTDEQHEKTVRAQANLPKIQATLREDDLYTRDKINWVFKFVAENPDKKIYFTITTEYRAMNSSKFLSRSSDMFENGVHVGTSGWLFLAEGTNDVRKLYCDPNFLSDEDIQKWRLLLLQRKLKLETASIEYLHVWVPEKLSIYSEFLGPNFPPARWVQPRELRAQKSIALC